MRRLFYNLTDFVSSKKGMWITLIGWLLVTIVLSVLAPSAREYEVSRLEPFPEDTPSVVAQEKMDDYFKDSNGIPVILVFQAKEGIIETEDFSQAVNDITEQNINGLEQVIPIDKIPLQALQAFLSEDRTTALLPMNFSESLDTDEINNP